jgi:hypothetical protein
MNTVDLLKQLEDEFYEPALCGGHLEFDGRTEPAEVLSLTAHSADLRCSNDIHEQGSVTLVVEGFRSFKGELVRRHGRIIGMMFSEPDTTGTRIVRAAGPAKMPVPMEMPAAAVEAATPKRGRQRSMRSHPRSAVFWSGALQAGRQNVECIVLNMSPGGAKVRMLKRFVSDGSPVILHIDRLGGYTCEVVWTEGNTIGLRFLKDPKQIAADIEQGLRKAPKPGASPAV